MSEVNDKILAKMRRSIDQEFVRTEEDFDATRGHRQELVEKLVAVAKTVKLSDTEGNLKDDALTGVAVINTALKALEATEKAAEKIVSLKLRRNEAEVASAAATKDRIAIILQATAPGRIEDTNQTERLAEKLSEMFDDQIESFELKSNPKDLSDAS